MQPVLCTYKEAAEMLGMTPVEISRLVLRGCIPAIGSGVGRRIIIAALQEWIPWRNDPPADFTPTGYVYLIRFQGFHKIGLSKRADKRFRGVSSGLPTPADLIHVIPTNSMVRLEAMMHRWYAKQRANGEWFKLEKRDVDFICQCKAYIFDV